MSDSVYEVITNSIIKAIEDGQAKGEFVMPWHGALTMPTNASTNKTYNGVNVPTLWIAQQAGGFASSEWATYKQWESKGAQVRKGEKGSKIVFWKSYETEVENDEPEKRMFASWSTVFNADQVDGYANTQVLDRPSLVEISEKSEAFMKYTLADIVRGGARAYYAPATDRIHLPDDKLFRDTGTQTATEGYYATAFHELTHWTGHKNRLDRHETGKTEYAKEELVAELGAAFLCAKLGVSNEPRPDHAEYVASWLKALKNDTKFIFSAAGAAQKAVAFMEALQPSSELAPERPLQQVSNGLDPVTLG